MYNSTEVFTRENKEVTHKAVQKYIHLYSTSILYAIYTNLEWKSHF
jgi:hypothetical protein